MDAHKDAYPLRELLEHQDLVRRLARALTSSEHDALDLEQDVWTAAARWFRSSRSRRNCVRVRVGRGPPCGLEPCIYALSAFLGYGGADPGAGRARRDERRWTPASVRDSHLEGG